MKYNEFLEYIYKRYSGNVKLGLDRITGILHEMDNPQNSFQGIHVGGTNGKGSTCAACEALLLEHGLHTGLNTSPHLIDYCERFRIDRHNVSFDEVLDIFHRFEALFEKWDASFFEITTAIAFQLFKEKQVEAAVIEVGLGGRLDATNLFIPQVSAITTIGLDHTKTLGETAELIAFEKAGIIKTGVPVVLGRIDSSPLQIIMEQAKAKEAPVIMIDRDILVTNIVSTAQGVLFDYQNGAFRFTGIQCNLLGRHQAVNVSIALSAFLQYCNSAGIKPREDKIRSALSRIFWMGRMQLLQSEPTVIVDGAHNLQGVEVFVANLQELFPGRKLRFVVSILADKDYKAMLRCLSSLAELFYISKNESERAAEIEDQAAVVRELGIPCRTAPTVREAFLQARAEATPDDVIIGAGSLYTVAEILSLY
jgi:dihydrofolate synthase/folylpolyglutamate synthase